jgi:hypothetical protein
MENGGDNRLARQINSYRLSAKGSNISLTQHRLEKLDATLKGIAAGLRG